MFNSISSSSYFNQYSLGGYNSAAKLFQPSKAQKNSSGASLYDTLKSAYSGQTTAALKNSQPYKVKAQGEELSSSLGSIHSAGGFKSVRLYIDRMNEVMDEAKADKGKGSQKLAADISGMNKTYSPSLEKIGITADKNGKLSIDEDKLKQAEEDGSLKKLFNEKFGYASRAETITSRMKTGSYYANQPQKSTKGSNYNYVSGLNASLVNLLF